uniref:Tetratricopeptide repeat protein n=1 Tax=candidate division WOR-3 bacterium TaxID=2052148 RepID=A0A7C4GFG9_UNCW3
MKRTAIGVWRLAVLCTGLLAGTAGADVGSLMRQGNRMFARGRFEEALGFYQRAEVLEPDATAIHYNLGNALYRLGRFPEAAQELQLAAVDKNPRRRAAAVFNAGNALFRMNRLDDAINAYKLALLANPGDRQAKQNLEFCLKKRQEQQQQPDSSGQNQQQQEQQQQPRPQTGMDKDQAERILQAVQNREKEAQQKAKPPRRREVEQDW